MKKKSKKYSKIPQGGHIMILLLFYFISLSAPKGNIFECHIYCYFSISQNYIASISMETHFYC